MPLVHNLLALALLALVALSFGPVHADASQAARHVHGRRQVAHRKRTDASQTGRCIPRTSSSLPASTPPPSASSVPTSTPTSTSAAAPSPTSSSKGCYAYGADSKYLANFNFPRVKYFYNWNPALPGNLAAYNLQGMSMLWGAPYEQTFASTVVSGYASIAMGFNEPNEPSQSNMTPSEAFNAWMQYINPLSNEGYILVSPACTNDQAGLDWYAEFFQLCTPEVKCQVDILAFHGYTTDAQAIIDYANKLHDTYGMLIGITEYADQNFSGTGGQASMDAVWDFAGQMVEFITNTDWIHMACPFGLLENLESVGVNTNNALITAEGYPTALASFYFSQL